MAGSSASQAVVQYIIIHQSIISLFFPPLLSNVSFYHSHFCHYVTGQLGKRSRTIYTPSKAILLDTNIPVKYTHYGYYHFIYTLMLLAALLQPNLLVGKQFCRIVSMMVVNSFKKIMDKQAFREGAQWFIKIATSSY